jgi:hypothetical protein
VADYTVPNGHIGVHEKTLVASTVDTVTFALGSPGTPGWARMPREVEVLTDGAADIYVTVDGSTPSVAGTNCWRVPAMPGATVINVQDADPADEVVVKLISSGTPKYSVARS